MGLETKLLENFEVRENILVANVDLCWEYHDEFVRKCEQLIQSAYEDIVLDLSDVTFIFSAYMGTIGHLIAESVRVSKRLTIRISQRLIWLFELIGFEKVIHVEVVP
ncbi:MAG: STAS domain-containing protein [Planctomycetota bacterium]